MQTQKSEREQVLDQQLDLIQNETATLQELPAVAWAFVLFVGVGFFLFEDVAKWLGILCYLGGGALTLKIVSDQGRSAGLWAVLSLMLGPVAALIVLALPRPAGAPPTKPTQVQRSLIALSPIVLCPVAVMVLLAMTGQGSFRVVKTSDLSGGYDLRFGIGENFCGKVVNVEGSVIATGRSVPVFSNPDDPVFAVSDGSGDAKAKEIKNAAVLSAEDKVSASAKIVGNKRYPLPQIGDRLRVGVIVHPAWRSISFVYAVGGVAPSPSIEPSSRLASEAAALNDARISTRRMALDLREEYSDGRRWARHQSSKRVHDGEGTCLR